MIKKVTPIKSVKKPITEKSKFIPELSTTKKVPNKSSQYVDNKQFLIEIIEYKKACKEAKKLKKTKPQIPNAMAKHLLLIAENLSHKPNFSGYSFKDEMIGDALENCVMYFDNFDPKRSKYPFAYFTKITYYAFVRRIQKEKRQLYTKYKATQQRGLTDDCNEDEEGIANPVELYENINDFISKYEEAQEESKQKSQKKVKLENFIES